MYDLYSATSIYLECKFSSKSDEVFVLKPICQNIDFRYKSLKYQCQIHTECLQIDWSANS